MQSQSTAVPNKSDHKKEKTTKNIFKKLFSTKKDKQNKTGEKLPELIIVPAIIDNLILNPTPEALTPPPPKPTVGSLFKEIGIDMTATLGVQEVKAVKRPSYLLLDSVTTALIKLKSNQSEMNEALQTNLLLLKDIYLQTKQTIHRIEDDRDEFKIDIDLQAEKERLRKLVDEEENKFEESVVKYNADLKNKTIEIHNVDEKITNVNAEQVIGNLKNLEEFQRIHLEITEDLNKANTAMQQTSGCFHFFCGPSSAEKKLAKNVADLENKRDRLANASLEDVRKQVVDKLNVDRDKKVEELQGLIDNQPQFNSEHENKYIELEARMRSDEIEYYNQIDDVTMLHFLRLYLQLSQVNKVLNDADPTKMQPALLTVKVCLSDLREELTGTLGSFYCATPGRYYFDNYLELLRQDKNNKVAIISGDAPIDVIRTIFPDYEPRLSGLKM